MIIKVGPTGNIIKGHVLDATPVYVERALRDYDPLLYIRWNPKKLRGWGVWEVRRRPERLSIDEIVEFDNKVFVKLGYVENNLVNHVMDVPYMNYSIVTKIIEMDTFRIGPNKWVADLDYKMSKQQEENIEKARKERKYAARYFKAEMKAFKELVQSGLNPAQIADYWNKVGHLS